MPDTFRIGDIVCTLALYTVADEFGELTLEPGSIGTIVGHQDSSLITQFGGRHFWISPANLSLLCEYPWKCEDCGTTASLTMDYMVVQSTWRAAGYQTDRGLCCMLCLEHRLARPLTDDDFGNVPINNSVKMNLAMARLLHPSALQEVSDMMDRLQAIRTANARRMMNPMTAPAVWRSINALQRKRAHV